MTTGGPLQQTLHRLRELDQYWTAEVGTPVGADWYRFDRIVPDGHIEEWFEQLTTRHAGEQRDVAGSFLASWLANALVVVPIVMLIVEARLPDLGQPVWVHQHSDGWFDSVSFESARISAVAGDPDANNPDVHVFTDRQRLVDRYADELVALVSPTFSSVRRLAPFGLRGMWGTLADEIGGAASWAARAASTDPPAAWRTAERVIDAIAKRTPLLRNRPQPFPVAWSGGETLFQVKGTCCLYYKTTDAPNDPSGDGYCNTCPLRPDDSRHRRLLDYLESESDHSAGE